MWCPNCQADVAAEVTADNRRVRCATCGSEVSLSSTTRTSAKTREARELLERWANDRLLSAHEASPASTGEFASEPPHSSDSSARRSNSADYDAEQPPAPKSRKYRVDRAHPSSSDSSEDDTAAANAERRISAVREREQGVTERTAAANRIPAPHASFDRPPARPAAVRRIHSAHATAAAPHVDIQAAIQKDGRPRTNWTSLTGQLLAYGGVALLTVGSSLVLWGYFGGPEQYAPTGWLVTTAGQMLLFLGVVTLVSGGMEQTTEEVKRRIETLGDKILRFEQTTRDHALRGPYISAERYESSEGDESDSAEAPSHSSRRRNSQPRGNRA